MPFKDSDHNSILFHQIKIGDKASFKEVIPELPLDDKEYILGMDIKRNITWMEKESLVKIQSLYPGNNVFITKLNNGDLKIDVSIYKDNRFENIHEFEGRIGIGRKPLRDYKFDISVDKNNVATSFHIGDGSFGFSFGNGSNNGFIPEIIGVGADEKDTGLYLLGVAGNNKKSDIPLIILDGRSVDNEILRNRPILGITSGKYDEYKVIIDKDGNVGIGRTKMVHKVEINGSILSDDSFIFRDDKYESISKILKNIENRLEKIEKKIKKD